MLSPDVADLITKTVHEAGVAVDLSRGFSPVWIVFESKKVYGAILDLMRCINDGAESHHGTITLTPPVVIYNDCAIFEMGKYVVNGIHF